MHSSSRSPIPRPLSSLIALLVFLAIAWSPGYAPSGQAGTGPALNEAPVVFAVGEPGQIDLVGGAVGVDTSSRSAVAGYYFSQYPVNEAALALNASVAGCTAGTTSASYKAAALQRINFYREMAGVPAASSMNATWSGKDQEAALVFAANRALSHDPPATWTCWTANADEAAGTSNIAIGVNGWTAIDLYMRDNGSNNAGVGHRRWILHPQTQSFGTGDVQIAIEQGDPYRGRANALWVQDGNMFAARPATRDTYVAWPPPGYVPYQVVFARWSLQLKDADFSGASVSMTLNGSSVPVTIDSRSSGTNRAPENVIVWRPNDMADNAVWPNPGSDASYEVRVSNVIVGGVSRTYTYTVTVFDPSTSSGSTPTATPTQTTTRTPTNTATATSTASRTPTNTAIPSATATRTPTYTATSTATATATATQTTTAPTVTNTATHTATSAATATATQTPTNTATSTATATATNAPTDTATATNSPTRTPSPTATRTPSPRCSGSPTTQRVGSSVTATCTGFLPGETVNVSWDSTRNGVLKAFTVDSAGAGKVSVKVPETPGGAHTLILKGAASRAQAKVAISVKPSVAISPKTGPAGTRITVTIRGFKPGEVLDVRWYVTSTSFRTVKNDVTANALGSLTTSFSAPSAAAAGNHKVEAVGQAGSKASYTFQVTTVQGASLDEPPAPPTRTPEPTQPPRPTSTPVPSEAPLPAATAEPQASGPPSA